MLMPLLLAGNVLSMRVDSLQKDLLVGEPVKVTIAWTAHEALKANLTNACPGLTVLVSSGKDWRPFRLRCYTAYDATAPDELAAGEERRTDIVLIRGKYDDVGDSVLFSAEGGYRLRLTFQPSPKAAPIESNVLHFNAAMPKDDDIAVLNRIKRDPGFLLSMAAEEAFVEHPNSPYLRIAGLRRAERRSTAAFERVDPETKETYWHLDRAQWQEHCARRLRPMADELLSLGSWGAFETDRLEKAADLLARAGDHEAAKKVRKEILERFPRSKAAQDIERARKEEEAMGEDPEDGPPVKRKQ